MHVPESWIERLPFLEPLENDWQPVPRAILIIASAFYLLFLFQAARGTGVLLMIDLVFIPIHEGGHLLFRIFGEFLAVARGSDICNWPLRSCSYRFYFQRQVPGTAFCIFFFFELFLPIATYMADARAQELPLLTVGDADYVIHDWEYLFTEIRGPRARHTNRPCRANHRLDRNARDGRLDGLAQPAIEE